MTDRRPTESRRDLAYNSMVIVLDGELAVPCTCNPLQQGRSGCPRGAPRQNGESGGDVDGWVPRIGKHLNRVRAGRQQH